MSRDFRYPRWQEPLAAAVLEFNPRELFVKVQTAEEAIANRFKELEFEKENQNEEELRLLSDGLSIIRGLKKDRLGSLATKKEPRKYHIYRCDKTNGYQWIASAETLEQAMADVAREHARNPHSEYRVINPNFGIVETILPSGRNS